MFIDSIDTFPLVKCKPTKTVCHIQKISQETNDQAAFKTNVREMLKFLRPITRRQTLFTFKRQPKKQRKHHLQASDHKITYERVTGGAMFLWTMKIVWKWRLAPDHNLRTRGP